MLSTTWNDLFCSYMEVLSTWLFFSDLQLILINSRIVRRHFASMTWNYGEIMAETRGYIFRWRCLSLTSYLLKLPNIQLFLIWLHGVESDLWFVFLEQGHRNILAKTFAAQTEQVKDRIWFASVEMVKKRTTLLLIFRRQVEKWPSLVGQLLKRRPKCTDMVLRMRAVMGTPLSWPQLFKAWVVLFKR